MLHSEIMRLKSRATLCFSVSPLTVTHSCTTHSIVCMVSGAQQVLIQI